MSSSATIDRPQSAGLLPADCCNAEAPGRASWPERWRAWVASWHGRECRRGIERLAGQLSAAERRDLGLHELPLAGDHPGWRLLDRSF